MMRIEQIRMDDSNIEFVMKYEFSPEPAALQEKK
jgi:hypothetical protein